jgi:autotransporter-associated beta strand protein
VTLDGSAIANLNSQVDAIGSLTGAGQVALGSGTLTTGGDNSSTSFMGVMTGLGGALTKTGGGTFALEGNNTYSGATTINAGVLLVNGQQPQSAVSILSGGQLGGVGYVGVISELNGHVAPGGSPGTLSCNGYSTFAPANLLKIDIDGQTPGSGHDQIDVHGGVLLMGGILQLSMDVVGAVSNQYVIINNDGSDAVSGTFTGLPEGGSLTAANGAEFLITYHGGDGNDVVLIQQTPGAGTKLSGAKLLADGTLQLDGIGQPNTSYNIEAAPGLEPPIAWNRIGTVTSDAAGLLQFIDADAPNYSIRFYRFVKP